MIKSRRQSNDEILALIEASKPLITYLRDVKTLGTSGGVIAGIGAFFPRILNTLEGDSSSVSLNNGSLGTDGTANRFILQPGTYHINARVPFGMQNGLDPQLIKLRLYNITDSSTAINGENGRMGDADVSLLAASSFFIEGMVTVTSAKTFEVQYRCSSVAGSVVGGLGQAASFTENEVYTQVKIVKVA